ncbi:protein FAM151B isoform X2 [Scleropages formosus]|nr:protein FAM151B isoform X2 [Scleropages formosus]XP_018615537.2 protein FAM151B isoform X2 [Scleropages formosus]
MGDRTSQHFPLQGAIQSEDALSVQWYHAANSKSKIADALKSSADMIEADVLLRGHNPKEPIMAHPPDTDSDITLHDWLKEVSMSEKGIKLDFKSLQAVAPSITLLEKFRGHLHGPVWINADILPGPGGGATDLDPVSFLKAVGSGLPGSVLSLGWTTNWERGAENPGYSWEMVREMEEVCRPLKQPVTFPVRAALLPQSFLQMQWLLQQSSSYSLTVWTGQADEWKVEDLLPYRQNIDKSRIYYDLLESQYTTLWKLPC